MAGNSFATRWISSLQIAAQVLLVSKPPMWCAMKLARGEDRQVGAALAHQQLVLLDALAQLVVADPQLEAWA